MTLDFALSSEQQMAVETGRDFVEPELHPHEEEVERIGRVPPELGEEIKRKVIELAADLAGEVHVFGGKGLMSDPPLARFWRDARVERIWDGTSEIQGDIVGRDLFRPLGA